MVTVRAAPAMLTPGVMDQVVAGVWRARGEQQGIEQHRGDDTRLNRRALPLD